MKFRQNVIKIWAKNSEKNSKITKFQDICGNLLGEGGSQMSNFLTNAVRARYSRVNHDVPLKDYMWHVLDVHVVLVWNIHCLEHVKYWIWKERSHCKARGALSHSYVSRFVFVIFMLNYDELELLSECRRVFRKCRTILQWNFGNLKSKFRSLEFELLQIWNASPGPPRGR